MGRVWEERKVQRFQKGREAGQGTEELVMEYPVTVFLNDKEVATLLCTPLDLEDLVVGFLFNEGLVRDSSDLESVEVADSGQAARVFTMGRSVLAERLYGKRTVTSGCGAGTSFYRLTDAWLVRPVTSDFTVKASQISQRMHDLAGASALYRRTRGVHAAAAASPEAIEVLKDDIGRHNAVDKVAGDMLRRGWDPSCRMLLITGRVSSEMVVKAARMGCPLLVSRASPTHLAVRMAQEAEITLAGFARQDSFAVFTRPDRVVEG
ncbi:MAG: formate dehydrogenase accessory sulfurtransferase FdhD [Bacillota bacterium]